MSELEMPPDHDAWVARLSPVLALILLVVFAAVAWTLVQCFQGAGLW